LIAAADYLLLGRLMLFVLPETSQRILRVTPRVITRLFVGCDILALLIQCSGSGVASSQNWVGNAGIDILMAGLGIQLATNVVFMALLAVFYRRTIINGMISSDAPEKWRTVLWVVIISNILIFVSC
jgi:RTA1 like protein